MDCCRVCGKELTERIDLAKDDRSKYWTCLHCTIPDIYPPAYNSYEGLPSLCAIQTFRDLLIKESLVVNLYQIDYRPGPNTTSIGLWAWNDLYQCLVCNPIVKFDNEVFNLDDLEQTEKRLKMILAFL